MITLAYLAIGAIFGSALTIALTGGLVLAAGLVLGWTARACWGKGRVTIDQVVLSQDVTAEWAAIWQAVQDEMEGK